MFSIGEAMGKVCGFVVDGVYVAGDTIWCEEVRAALELHRPRVVVVNAGGAHFIGSAPIVMTAADVREVRRATESKLVVVHLEAMNHCVECERSTGNSTACSSRTTAGRWISDCHPARRMAFASGTPVSQV